jgi:DAPG hydrolase PhiG domain
MKFEECSQILSPKQLAFESGLERLDNGMVHVAVLTRMPGVTAEMIAWWFGEYMQTSEHYRRWHPTDHVWMGWQDKQPGTHLGAKHLVHEYVGGRLFKLRIHFLPPENFLGNSIASEPERLLICAKISFLNYPLTIA